MGKDITYLVTGANVKCALCRYSNGEMYPIWAEDSEVLRAAGMLSVGPSGVFADQIVTQATLAAAGQYGFAVMTYAEMQSLGVRNFIWAPWLMEARCDAFVYDDDTLAHSAIHLKAWCHVENREQAGIIMASLRVRGSWMSLDAKLREDGRVKLQMTIFANPHYHLNVPAQAEQAFIQALS